MTRSIFRPADTGRRDSSGASRSSVIEGGLAGLGLGLDLGLGSESHDMLSHQEDALAEEEGDSLIVSASTGCNDDRRLARQQDHALLQFAR